MRLAVLLIAPVLAGCPYVASGEIEIVEGSAELGPAKSVSFVLYCDYLFDGRERAAGGGTCDGAWGVGSEDDYSSEVQGGSATLGFIDECGVYQAPLERPPGPIIIIASECSSFGCADACGAGFTPSLAGYDL